ncbi:hypothetical protein THRCLA_06077 [Thraustotheca clavata]|uniref:Cytochrome P450 n=1 Tax=Thraustotheca clavata TaxID=74557 RepID=A0A1V9ZQI9_9STRA|nr:hypothetical protein THRCLA_06077 [Thraustotheca clavata]
MPRTSGSLPTQFLGHLGELNLVRSTFDPSYNEQHGALVYRLLQKLQGYYEETKSKTFRLNMAGTPLVVTKDPKVYKSVLGPFQKHFANSVSFRKAFGYFAPSSMIVLESKSWNRVRKVATRALALQSIDHIPSIVCSTVDTWRSIQPENALDFHLNPDQEFPKWTFDCFNRLMYNWDSKATCNNPLSLEVVRDCGIISHAMSKRMMLPYELLWKLPLPENQRIDQAKERLMMHTFELVHARREAVDERQTTLLDCLLVASEEARLSTDEVYDQVFTFFFAAFDTISHTLSLLLNHLAADPTVQEELRQAILQTFPNGKSDIAKATLDDLNKCDYLTWVVNEIFRLTPTTTGVSRTCIKSCVINGYQFDVGDQFLFDGVGVGRTREYFQNQPDLDAFRPRRFAQLGSIDKTLSMPFGMGSRICPGRKLAVGQLKAFCAYIILSYDLTRPALLPLLYDMTIGITIKHGYDKMIWRVRDN